MAMLSDVISLVDVTVTYDDIGQPVEIETLEDIFVEVESVSRSEWVEAGRMGLKPEYKFTTPFTNYDGQKTVKHKGNYYAVYRTYLAGDNIELYVEARGGLE